MMPSNLPRLPKKRRCSHSASPFVFSILCTCKLLIFLLALGERKDKLWVRAQTDHSQCYSDLYASDRNGDGRVDAEEYVEFSRLRLEQRLQVYPDGHTYDVSSAGITTFVFLPPGLQSNFYTLACLCSRFDFDDATTDNGSCCIGDNAHLFVLSDANGAEGIEDDEVRYSNIVCTFTDRAVDGVISTMEKVESPPPSIAPVQTTTMIPTSPTTPKPTNPPSTSTPTNSPTIAPTTLAPTNSPTSSPSIRTDQPSSTPTRIAPTLSPTTPPSLRTVVPTSFPTVTPSIKPTTTLAPVPQIVQPTNITIKTSYSILAQEKEQMLKDIHSDCIDGMDILAGMVANELWSDEEIILEKSVFHDRLFVELPTSVDKIEEMGFTSTPKLVDMKFDGDDGDSKKVFQGGPCPTEMEFGSEKREYKCFNVTASILLRVIFDDYLVGEGITADDVEDLYTNALEQKILRGALATVHEEKLLDSTVIMATGQIVSGSTNVTKPGMRVGVIVGLATGGLLLILILFYLIILHRKRQKQRGDDKETVANPEEDLEARNSPSSKSSSGAGSPGAVMKKNSTFVPYFQNDASPGASFGAEDTKSIGGISAESDAGWSEAYTSSMGSVSDDGVGDLDSPSRTGSPGRLPMMSLSMGPSSVPIETEDSSAVSPMKESQISENASAATPNTPTSTDALTSISAVSPITPKSLQVLEESISDNDDEIMIHEDFSDEENDGDKKDEDESSNKKKESPEEFRARVHDLIERIVPEEIDQIDSMIAEFKNREDELVETLLAMEKRAIAQKEKIDAAPPSSPEREGSTSN
mmetsp:Transcript_8025/g.19740  ORF Transcript_8025/g.19740 Transcript_8025/m.19740 type:complete len:808 (+) Transcript_8025:156-2579(+)